MDRIMLMSHNAVSLFVETKNEREKYTINDANRVRPHPKGRIFNIFGIGANNEEQNVKER